MHEDRYKKRTRIVRNFQGTSHDEAVLEKFRSLANFTGRNECHGEESSVSHNNASTCFSKIYRLYKDKEFYYIRKRTSFTGDLDRFAKQSESLLESTNNKVNFPSNPKKLVVECNIIFPGCSAKGRLMIDSMYFTFSLHETEVQRNSEFKAHLANVEGTWNQSDILSVAARRYMLRPTAVELLLRNKTRMLLNFEREDDLIQVLLLLPTGNDVLLGRGSLKNFIKPNLRTPSELFQKSTFTEKWQSHQLSNFEYLMEINAFAGRSYNDLNQYPVFPWILSDYSSETINLLDPRVYRDLSRPVGALNKERLAIFKERFETWSDPEVPSFHYGSHYSTASYVLYWLIRLEPFTTLFLNFQGGKFDQPSRIFSSIKKTWQNCNQSTSDVKELIPELFYLPEMFININHYNFGKLDKDDPIGDVVLPNWCNNDPYVFVQIHKAALESDYVSAHLHYWLDLIFGYKQQGEAAVEANNIFYYLTYENASNLETVIDPVLKDALKQQITSFGQTPSQLLYKPHPPRLGVASVTRFYSQSEKGTPLMNFQVSNSSLILSFFDENSQSLLDKFAVLYSTVPYKKSSSRASLYIYTLTDSLLLSFYKITLPESKEETFPSLLFQKHIQSYYSTSDVPYSENTNHFVISKSYKLFWKCSYPDNSFKAFSLMGSSSFPSQSIYYHCARVDCIAMSPDEILLATASSDTTVMVWCASQNILNNGLVDFYPITVLYYHRTHITALSICADLDIVFSAGEEFGLVHSAYKGILLRKIPNPADMHARFSMLTSNSLLIVYYEGLTLTGVLAVYTINGHQLVQLKFEEQITTITATKDGESLLVATINGTVKIFVTYNLTELHMFQTTAPICSLVLSESEDLILVGLANGSLLLYCAYIIDWNQGKSHTEISHGCGVSKATNIPNHKAQYDPNLLYNDPGRP
ncbi:lipopolysaccharide-responsive and beige-like anchor protein [Zophobas morio]|uniref:lipopolysaccharide-responsive and beige-like anchor protein n=1 Tax=Zophobas morio TaxID=2755281 RepID=UPI003083C614